MAKYQWTGAGETIGAAPTLFSNMWGGTLSEWEVQEDLTADNEGKVLAFVNLAGSSVRRALQLDSAGSAISGRVDIRGRVWKSGNNTSLLFSMAYIGGASGTETAATTNYTSTGDGWRVTSYTSGSFALEFASNVSSPEGWYRFRALYDPAASTGKGKLWVWADTDPEPTTPIATKDTIIGVATGSGGLGLGAFSPQEGYIDWVSFGTAGDDADDLSGGSAPVVRKGSQFTADKTIGTVTTATLNGVNVFDHLTAQDGTTATFAGALTDEITTSGEYTLALGDGTTTENITVQVNVYGITPSNNPVEKDGAAQASLTGVQVRVTDGANLNGTELYYTGTATTDASGNLTSIDLSSTAAVEADPVLLHIRTAAGDSIIASETVGLI